MIISFGTHGPFSILPANVNGGVTAKVISAVLENIAYPFHRRALRCCAAHKWFTGHNRSTSSGSRLKFPRFLSASDYAERVLDCTRRRLAELCENDLALQDAPRRHRSGVV
jgi:hypothetical protein